MEPTHHREREVNRQSHSEENWLPTNAEIANQVISKYTTSSSSTSNNKRKQTSTSLNDQEYNKKRARNNVAVKKSREKAKNRIVETQVRVEQLSNENEELQTKVTLLTKELNVLRALFTNGGFALPGDLQLLGGTTSPELSAVSHSQSISTISHHSSPNSSNSPSHYESGSSKTSYETSSKSYYESKVQPVKPLPRILPTAYHHHLPKSPPSPLPSSSYTRDLMYDYPSKYPTMSDYIKRETKDSYRHSPVILPPGLSSSTSPSSSSLYQTSSYGSSAIRSSSSPHHSNSSTQHTSVIRTTTAENFSLKSSQNNPLGKFCIIQDPEKEGQIKIVPIES